MRIHRGLCLTLAIAGALVAPSLQAAIIVNDSWADGGRTDGADPLDSAWYTSANSNGIEVAVGSLGMVTGTQGRGIHTIFPTQTLANIGDRLVATYTFRTPTTIGSGAAGFRVGLFGTLGRAGLNADITASSTTPNAEYGWGTGASPAGPGTAGLPGYMLDMDVGATQAEDINYREHDPGTVNPTGRLMGTTTGFTQTGSSGPDDVYSFAANTTYTGSFSLKRVSATELELTGAMGASTYSVTDVFDSASYGMLAFWSNSNLFGSSATPGAADNGIDFSNVTIEFLPVPEPVSLSLAGLAVLAALGRVRRSG